MRKREHDRKDRNKVDGKKNVELVHAFHSSLLIRVFSDVFSFFTMHLYGMQSSAKSLVLDRTQSGRSFIKT